MGTRVVVSGLEDDARAGLETMASHLGMSLVTEPTEADLHVTVTEMARKESGVSLRVSGALDGSETVRITYDGERARLWRALGHVVEALRHRHASMHINETCRFERVGVMVDCSRNAVTSPDTARWLITAVAAMGVRSVLLYTEDTYELESHPYFGWRRGRYGQDELRALDDFADTLGVELVPCIQVLGHLATTLHWPAHRGLADTSSVLDVGNDGVTELIVSMFDALAATFRTRRIHLGMDETHDLGRGKHLDRHGYQTQAEIYVEHLTLVTGLARARGLEPMIWSDMMFRMAGGHLDGYRDYDERVSLDAVVEQLPDDVTYVGWDYYSDDAERYSRLLAEHRKLPGPTVMAGGVWAWNTFAVQLTRSLGNAAAICRASDAAGVREVWATIWHNGAESIPLTGLTAVQAYAEYDHAGTADRTDLARRVATTCGVDWADVRRWEEVEQPTGDVHTGLARTLLYNDPLGGGADGQIAEVPAIAEHYRGLTKALKRQPPAGAFAAAQQVITALSAVLELKADFGVRLRAAYERRDEDTLAALAEECVVITERLDQLRVVHRAAWFTYHKPHGWEVLDLRYGALMARFGTARMRIEQLLDGAVEDLDELAGPMLRLDGHDGLDRPFSSRHNWMRFEKIYTAGLV